MKIKAKKYKKKYSLFFILLIFAFLFSAQTAWAKRTVKGKIKFKDNGGPAFFVRVTAYDEDVGRDDKLGSDETNIDGEYKITFDDNKWDPSIPGTKKQRPDIFIRVHYKAYDGDWIDMGRSKTYSDHAKKNDITINLTVPTDKNKSLWDKAKAAWKKIVSYAEYSYDPRLQAYHIFFKILGSGAAMKKLPGYVKNRLSKYYTPGMLDKIKYGTSNHIWDGNDGMTDAFDIYLRRGDKTAEAINSGKLFSPIYESELRLFLHELVHSEQSIKVGGRNKYAEMWFKQVIKQVSRESIKMLLVKREINGKLIEAIHKNMPMEKDAERRAVEILNALKNE